MTKAKAACMTGLVLVAIVTTGGCPVINPGSALGLQDWGRDLLTIPAAVLIGELVDQAQGTNTPVDRDALVADISEQVFNDLESGLDIPGQTGPEGPAGPAGLSCWDLDGDGVADPEEDINGDGDFDALDCQGADGTDGADGDDGTNGTNGEDGEDGISCWDINGNGQGDPAEDVNDDGDYNALDCGLNCWDINGNGVRDPDEDRNGDNEWNALDCQGDCNGCDSSILAAVGCISNDGAVMSGFGFLAKKVENEAGRYAIALVDYPFPQGFDPNDLTVLITPSVIREQEIERVWLAPDPNDPSIPPGGAFGFVVLFKDVFQNASDSEFCFSVYDTSVNPLEQ